MQSQWLGRSRWPPKGTHSVVLRQVIYDALSRQLFLELLIPVATSSQRHVVIIVVVVEGVQFLAVGVVRVVVPGAGSECPRLLVVSAQDVACMTLVLGHADHLEERMAGRVCALGWRGFAEGMDEQADEELTFGQERDQRINSAVTSAALTGPVKMRHLLEYQSAFELECAANLMASSRARGWRSNRSAIDLMTSQFSPSTYAIGFQASQPTHLRRRTLLARC